MAKGFHSHIAANNPNAKPFNEELFDKAFQAMDKSGEGRVTLEDLNALFVSVAEKWGLIVN